MQPPVKNFVDFTTPLLTSKRPSEDLVNVAHFFSKVNVSKEKRNVDSTKMCYLISFNLGPFFDFMFLFVSSIGYKSNSKIEFGECWYHFGAKKSENEVSHQPGQWAKKISFIDLCLAVLRRYKAVALDFEKKHTGTWCHNDFYKDLFHRYWVEEISDSNLLLPILSQIFEFFLLVYVSELFLIIRHVDREANVLVFRISSLFYCNYKDQI